MKKYIIAFTLMAVALGCMAQESSNSGVRRRDTRAEQSQSGTGVTERMRQQYGETGTSLSEGDVQWMRVIYRQIDLDKDVNAALYYPEDVIDGQENLFRIIMRLLANNELAAYEYLDGREVFTDEFRINVRDMLDRFYIYYTPAKGSTERNPKFTIQESDVPANEVLSYYVIERWEFDNRNNRMRTRVDALCPVLHRSGDFGGDAVKYPMFWVKYADLRPHLAKQEIFVSDDNNLATYTYDDFFNLTMYSGDIYKTRNLRNRSMMQMYPDPDDLKRAQDSIQARLDSFETKLWVPDREQIIAAREAREQAASGDSTAVVDKKAAKEEKKVRSTSRSSNKKSTKAKKPKSTSSSSSSPSSAGKSVRRKK